MKWLTVLLLFLTANLFSQVSGELDSLPEVVKVGKIRITGNKVTKKKIITRELEFEEGGVYSKNDFKTKVDNSRKNLLNLQLFNFVTIKTSDSAGYTNVNVDVVERWYLWPVPIFGLADRNFNVWWETKDWSRLNYGIDLKHDNFLGRMEKLHLVLQNGYDKKVIGKWIVPYINKKQNIGFYVAGGLRYNHETNYKDTLNRLVFYRFEDTFARKMYFAELGFSYRPGFNARHFLNFNYTNTRYNDSLLIFNPELTYGQDHFQYFSVGYYFKLDHRDYAPYPLNGYYFDFSVRKDGLGLLSKDINNWNSYFNFDQYFQIYKKLYFAYRVGAYYSPQEKFQPYFLTTGIGYNGFDLRGYELVVIRGQRMMLFKSNLKLEVIPMKVHDIKFIKSDKFGKIFYAVFLNLFFDSGYASDHQTGYNNPLGNQILWSSGLGLDIISFYSIVVRLEYSVNKQGNTGFYLGMVAPI